MMCGLIIAAQAVAMSEGHQGHKMDHSAHMGKLIRTTKVDGFTFAYHLIDMKEKMATMDQKHTMAADAMENMKSHHLMLYIEGPKGEKIKDAKVGYLVTSSDGNKQKAMTMAMTGGYGADVDFKAAGSYTVKTKVVHGEAKLADEFEYTAE